MSTNEFDIKSIRLLLVEDNPADARVVERHLNDCSPCFEAFDFEAELRIVIRRRCTESVPDRLRKKIADAIDWTDADPPAAHAG